MGRVSGKVAIVTGGSRGLGAAQAKLLAAEGANVMLTSARSVDKGNALARELGNGTHFMRHDVRKAEDWKAVVVETERRFGPISVLINNAGITIPSPIENQTEEQFREIFEVNQLGTFLGIQAVAPSMKGRGGGSIINISSIAGLRASVSSIAYGGTKFALRGLTKTAAIGLARSGIRVNIVFPGFFVTDVLTDNTTEEQQKAMAAGIPLGRLGAADEIAPLVLFLASDESSYCTGGEFVIDGGLTAQ